MGVLQCTHNHSSLKHFYTLKNVPDTLVSAELNNIPTETTSSNCTGSVLYSSYTNSMMSVLIVLSTEEVKIHIANSWLQYLHARISIV